MDQFFGQILKLIQSRSFYQLMNRLDSTGAELFIWILKEGDKRRDRFGRVGSTAECLSSTGAELFIWIFESSDDHRERSGRDFSSVECLYSTGADTIYEMLECNDKCRTLFVSGGL